MTQNPLKRAAGYKDLLAIVGRGRSRTSAKLGNHTYATKDSDGTINVKYHATNIMSFHPDGSVTLRSGGWKTMSTKERLNFYMPFGFFIAQDKGVWYITKGGWGGKRIRVFADEMTVSASGKLRGGLPLKRGGTRIKKSMVSVNAYAKAFVDALFAAKVPPPSNGDCWDCVMRHTKTGKTMGEINGRGTHIASHIKERYYVPSLLATAMERRKVSKAAWWVLGAIWQPSPQSADTIRAFGAVAKREMVGALRRYIRQQMGMVS